MEHYPLLGCQVLSNRARQPSLASAAIGFKLCAPLGCQLEQGTGRAFFPHLISGPFKTGLQEAFVFAIIACLLAAAASLMRGGRYWDEETVPKPERQVLAPIGPEEQHAS